MGFFSFLQRKSADTTSILTSADLAAMFAGAETSAGVSVSQASAIQFSTVWACVRLLAECIAQLPCHVYVKNRDGSRSRVTDIALADILSSRPNFWQTPFEYTEFMVTSLAMRGNHYALINRGSNGTVQEMIPFNPAAVEVKRDGLNNVRYRVRQENGRVDTFPLEQISHVRGMSFDNFTGISPITYHRETIGLAMAASEYGGKLFKNGARPSGVIRHPNTLTQDAYERLKKYWQQMYGGSNTGKTAILEEGSEYQTISMSNEDAQYLDVRQFQRTEICSIFRIPPHMIGDLTKSSFSNITQQSLEFVKYTILPWCRRIESAMQRDLLTPAERKKGMFVQYLVDGLERADIETRYKAYQLGIQGGFLSPNEVRRKENLNPRPNGDIYLTPMNMIDSSGGLPDPNKPAKQAKNTNHEKHAIKSRQLKGVEAREQIRKKFHGRFAKLAAMLVKYETGQVRSALAADNLNEKITDIYADMPRRITETFRTLMREYGMAVRDAALRETEAEGGVDVGKFGNFVDDLLAAFAARHVSSSTGQLAALIRDTAPDELQDVIDQRLTEWQERRPEKIAERETIQQESATARYVFAAAGVTKLVWVLRGSKSCPLCSALSGKVVGIEAPFIEQGNYEPEGYEASPWKVRGPKLHPQLHEGCQCAIAPM